MDTMQAVRINIQIDTDDGEYATLNGELEFLTQKGTGAIWEKIGGGVEVSTTRDLGLKRLTIDASEIAGDPLLCSRVKAALHALAVAT